MKIKFIFCQSLSVVILVLCSCLTGFSQTTNSFFRFVNDQSARHYSEVPHEVLALYYGWYGNPERPGWKNPNTNKHAIENTAHYPVKGPYNSHDPATIDWQIDQAKAHGITGFVVSWWGKGEHEAWNDQTLALLLERSEKKNFKISIYWEHERNTEAQLIQFAVDDLTYVLERYGKKEAFLKVDGKPVIFAYENIQSQTPLASLAEIIQRTRTKAGDFLLIGQGYQANSAYLFDGLHTSYGNMDLDLLANSAPEKINEFRENAAQNFTKGAELARRQARISCPMIIPGFDNTKSSPARVKANRYDGQTYRTLWEEAIKTKPDWILISSWNEWPEATEIEPSLELGDKYLNITAEYAKQFLNSPTVSGLTSVPLPKKSGASEIDKLLAGQAVGLLLTGGSYDAEFWADYCGATAQRLTWPDLIAPTKFNAKKIPLLIYVGGEHFVSSLKVTDDVTQALIHYLRGGGFLVVLPVGGVWPFYYDQSRGDKPATITDKIGLGVTGAWDSPPSGTELRFYVNKKALLGLPATAAYPTSGDLRFRPATRKQVAAYDYYLPLAQLWDKQMHFQGDAAVYIEHKTAPLSPGRTIYISMQTPGAFGSDEFYPSLYQFISTKLKPLPPSNP